MVQARGPVDWIGVLAAERERERKLEGLVIASAVELGAAAGLAVGIEGKG